MSDAPHSADPLEPMVHAYREAEREVERARPVRDAHRREVLQKLLDEERQRTHAELVPHRAVVWGGVAALAALCLCGVGFALLAGDEPSGVPDPPALALRAVDPGCHISKEGEALSLMAECSWVWSEHFTRLDSTSERVVLTPVTRGLRVERGEVVVEVDPSRPRSFPVRLLVSGGVIEVVGTRFTIREFTTHGEVTLHKGSIRFWPADGGDAVMIEPGQSWRWGDSPEESTRTSLEVEEKEPVRDVRPPAERSPDAPVEGAPSATLPRPRHEPAERLPASEEVRLTAQDMRVVRRHRRLGEFRDAVALLDKLDRRTTSRATREVISYEKGDILSEMSDVGRQCAHWRHHLERFPRGRYADQVKTRLDALSCAP